MEPEAKLSVREAAEVMYCGTILAVLYPDGTASIGGRMIGRIEVIALTVALMGRLCTRGQIDSEQSVDEAMHSLEMIAAEPFMS